MAGQERTRKIGAFVRAARRLTRPGAAVDPADLDGTLDGAVDLLDAGSGFIVIPDPSAGLRVLAARGIGRQPLEPTEKLICRRLFHEAMKRDEPLVLPRVALHPLFTELVDSPSFKGNTRSALTATLSDRGKRLGVLLLHETKRNPPFGPEDVENLSILAQDAALVVTNYLRAHPPAAPTATQAIVGESPEIVELRRQITDLAPSPTTVLILGARGVGKELVARALHDASPRHAEPFISTNMSAHPAALFEAELFGHLRGAFTGADQDREGIFLAARGGTVFLDEIAETPLDQQKKLLRVLQEKKVVRTGSPKPVPVRARIVAATNKDLKELVAAGLFASDLYDRLRAITIRVPPLRERSGDVAVLVRHLLPQIAAEEMRPVPLLPEDVSDALEAYDWPGNVRELEIVLRTAVFHDPSRGPLTAELLEVPRAPPKKGPKPVEEPGLTREQILEAVRVAGGNKLQAAKALGITRAKLYRRLDEGGPA